MLVLDIEASGTEYQLHSIVSIGALDLQNPDNRFYAECCIWDGAEIMKDALAVNGFTEAEITDSSKSSEAEAVIAFLEWSQHLGDRTITGQNPSFDRDFVRAAASRAHLSWDLAYRTLDTHTMCFMHHIIKGKNIPVDPQHRRSALDLDAVMRYCGIPEEPQPHNALTGALAHAEVTSRLLFNKKLLPEFEQFAIPWM